MFAASVAWKFQHPHDVPLSFCAQALFEDERSVPANSIAPPVEPETLYIDPRPCERWRSKPRS